MFLVEPVSVCQPFRFAHWVPRKVVKESVSFRLVALIGWTIELVRTPGASGLVSSG